MLLEQLPLGRFLIVVGLICCLFAADGCITSDSQYERIAPGIWRGVLTLEKPTLPIPKDKDSVSLITDQFKVGELPFNFEVKYTDPTHFYIEFINGDERIRCDSMRAGRDRTTARDTYNFYFPEYQSYIHAEVRGDAMQGYFTVTTKKDYRIPFVADAGRGHRFTTLREQPAADLSGEWATLLGVETPDPDRAIGEFKQSGNRLTGTFRTETGDFRYLEGTVQGRKFFMSCFDGSHAFLFSGVIKGDSLLGEFRSGLNQPTLWTAWRDPSFKLGAADSLTTVKQGAGLHFNVQTPDGRTLTYPGPTYDGKVGIFTISGTWCPNCKDEQSFLRDYLAQNPAVAQQTAVTVFSFERHEDLAQANAHLTQYRKVLNLPFDVVYAGKAKKEEAAKVFPMLSQVMAFPTMMIVDKQGKVRLVHTGFDGPATSKYAEFKAEFAAIMRELTQG
jgi:thiol-disulfide isomerase/thioredoxin